MSISKAPLVVKILLFIFLGFLVLTLIGPVIALLVNGAIFAGLGYAAWKIYGWSRRSDPAPVTSRHRSRPHHQPERESPPPMRTCASPETKTWFLTTARWLGSALMEIGSGVVVGGLLGFLATWESPQYQPEAVALGAALGGMLGFLVGRSLGARTSGSLSHPEEELG